MRAPVGPAHEFYGDLAREPRPAHAWQSTAKNYGDLDDLKRPIDSAVEIGCITQEHADKFPWATYVAPFVPGGFITIEITGEISESERRSYCLTRQSMEKGIKILSVKYVRHFADILTGNDDADTADAWLQCCLFGEVIFG